VTEPSAPAAQRAQQISIAAAVLTSLSCARVSVAADVPNTGEVQLQEVIVTATRHETSVQDVPYSISAVTGATLESQGVVDIAGLASSMPGMVYTDKGPYGGVSGANLIMRGLNSNPTFQLYLPNSVVPPVATYVDDTPLFVNLRLEDLNRVEVLRGPQGTLYGSGSLGGTVRFIQNAPDPHAFEAKVDAGMSSTYRARSLNYDVDAVLNVPLSPTFALRIAGSYSDQAGYIDQPNLYELNASGAPIPRNPVDLFSAPLTEVARATNNYGYRTARVAALWQPDEGFQMALNYYHQLAEGGGFPYNSPLIYGAHSLDSADNIREPINDTVDLVALTAKADLGFARLTSSSSWFRHHNDTTSDLSALYENFASYSAYYGSNPRALFVGHDGLDDEGEVQEFRLVSKAGAPVEWVAGLFFEHQKTNINDHESYPGYNDYYNACTAQFGFGAAQCGFGEYYGTTPQIDGIPLVKDEAYIGDVQTVFRDAAAYGDVTWHLTTPWQVTGGTRVFDEKVDQSQQTGLLFDGPDFVANQTRSVRSSRPLWRLNTSYNLDPTNLAYATWSQGFRRGGVNALPPVETFGGVTNQILFKYAPDTANNYEVGFKGTLNGHYRYSLDVYDIEWHNVQQAVNLTALTIPSVANIGNAYSRGAELQLEAEIATHWYAELGYTYDETKLTSVSEQAIIGTSVPTEVGGRLPGTPLNAAFCQLEYRHRAGPYELRFAVDGRYQSQVTSSLTATDPKAGGYTTWNLRVNALRGPWFARLYVDNVSNILGISAYTDPASFGNRWTGIVSRPRTVGFSMGYDYQ
jgi:iron complex outermembrane recepter protein